ncbi:MAG: transcriptional regulator GutM [Solibacillus sp.]
MWWVLFLIFIFLWMMQVWLTTRQVKHYRQTVQVMSDREAGYLGVGVEKKRFGKGTVMIVVSDELGTVIDCELMSGVTVFSKFKKCKRFIGKPLYQELTDVEEDIEKVYQLAVRKIEEQISKEERVMNLG